MNRAERRRWASARSLADVGELTVLWLHGQLVETPGHAGPPCDETIPHVVVLAASNRAGFVTENSQSADGPWKAYVFGWIADTDLPRLNATAGQHGVVIDYRCRGREHHGHRRLRLRLRPCPASDPLYFYELRCPAATPELDRAWYVRVADPEPGRNDRLWPALAEFAGLTESTPHPTRPLTRSPMASQALDFCIMRKRRKVAELQVSADPDDPDALQKILKGWLQGDGWDKGRWGEFHAEVRLHGRGRVETTVRL